MFAYITKVNIYFKTGRHVIWKQILLALICRALHFCSMPTLGAMRDFLRRGKFEAWRNIRDEIIQFCGILVKSNPIFSFVQLWRGFTILYDLQNWRLRPQNWTKIKIGWICIQNFLWKWVDFIIIVSPSFKFPTPQKITHSG